MVDKLAAGAIGAGLGYAGILSGGVTGGAAAVLGSGNGFTNNLAQRTPEELEFIKNSQAFFEKNKDPKETQRQERVRNALNNIASGRPPSNFIVNPSTDDLRTDWTQYEEIKVRDEPTTTAEEQYFQTLSRRNDPEIPTAFEVIYQRAVDSLQSSQLDQIQNSPNIMRQIRDYIMGLGAGGSIAGVVSYIYSLLSDPNTDTATDTTTPETTQGDGQIATGFGGFTRGDPDELPETQQIEIPLAEIKLPSHCQSHVYYDPITKRRKERITCISPRSKKVTNYYR